MKKIILVTIVAALALFSAATAYASGSITITSARVQPDQHLAVTWSGPSNGIEFGSIQLATRPETGTDGDFYSENRIGFHVLAKGQQSWIDTEPLPVTKKAGSVTLYVRLSGWDDFCEFHDYGYGITQWLGCVVWSPVAPLTIQSVCRRVLVKKGRYVKRGNRRVRIKPVYKTVCRWQ
jgi:hypothetical protein